MDRIIYHSIKLTCNVQRAFETFTVKEYLEGRLAAKADVEPKVSGEYELFWNPEDRENIARLGVRRWLLRGTGLCVLSGKFQSSSRVS